MRVIGRRELHIIYFGILDGLLVCIVVSSRPVSPCKIYRMPQKAIFSRVKPRLHDTTLLYIS